MSDAVGMAVCDGLEYAFRPVGFSGMDGFLEKIFVRQM
jgi:hypothetical protein